MLFKINPQSFNAVMACAAKDDVRYYLNTFYVDTDNRRLVATNGHILAFAPLEKIESGQDAEPDISRFGNGFLFKALARPIANSGDHVFIDCGKLELSYHAGRNSKAVKLEKCDGIFLDYDRVKYSNDIEEVEKIAFQPEYVAKMIRWADITPGMALFSFNGQNNSMGVKISKLPDVHITLMPGRI